MTDEEKEAIEALEGLIVIFESESHPEAYFEATPRMQKEISNSIKIVLKLVEKQEKELEELKKEIAINYEIHKRDLEIEDLKETIECLHESSEEFIRKSKIRDKIKELDQEIASPFGARPDF